MHNETTTGVTSDIGGCRKAMDATSHPALLLVRALATPPRAPGPATHTLPAAATRGRAAAARPPPPWPRPGRPGRPVGALLPPPAPWSHCRPHAPTVGPLFLQVDGVSSIGALDFRFDDWRVDVAVTGSQKALSLPTGLAVVCASQKVRGWVVFVGSRSGGCGGGWT